MKNELWGRGMVIGLLALVTCLLVGVALAINPGWPVVLASVPVQKEPVDYVDLASAFGTVGAFVAAIWIASRQSVLKRRDDMTRASLVAAGMTARLKNVTDELGKILMWGPLEFEDDVDPSVVEFRAIQKFLASGYFRPTRDDLFALVPLPHGTSFRLAQAYDVLGRVEEGVRAGGQFETDFLEASGQSQHALVERIRDQLHTAWDYMRSALRDCKNAAALNVRYPSADELFPPKAK